MGFHFCEILWFTKRSVTATFSLKESDIELKSPDCEHWQKRILRKRKELKKFITHGQTMGNYLEVLVRRFLRGHMVHHKVAHGIIRYADARARPQIDVIIYDPDIAKPFYRYGELAIVSSECVKAVVEVRAVFGLRKGWSELEKLEKMVGLVKEGCSCKVFYLCLDSDKYTLGRIKEKKSDIKATGLDGFFVLQARKYPRYKAPRGKATERVYNKGELERLVNAILKSL